MDIDLISPLHKRSETVVNNIKFSKQVTISLRGKEKASRKNAKSSFPKVIHNLTWNFNQISLIRVGIGSFLKGSAILSAATSLATFLWTTSSMPTETSSMPILYGQTWGEQTPHALFHNRCTHHYMCSSCCTDLLYWTCWSVLNITT